MKDEYCLTTANFLLKGNNLFDCLNRRNLKDPNPLRRPLSDENSQVEKYLKDSLLMVQEWQTDGALLEKPTNFSGFNLTSY